MDVCKIYIMKADQSDWLTLSFYFKIKALKRFFRDAVENPFFGGFTSIGQSFNKEPSLYFYDLKDFL